MRKRLVATTVLAASVILGIPAAAHAAPASCQHVQQTTGTNAGLLNGWQVALPISLGLGITDNAFGLLGYASSSRSGGDTTSCA